MNKQEIEKAIDVLDGNKEGFENLLKDQPDHPMRGHIEHQIDCLKVAIQALEKQVPVAFDVDKVVKQLKECERYIYDAVSDEDNYVIDTEKAIEIVKGGGQG